MFCNQCFTTCTKLGELGTPFKVLVSLLLLFSAKDIAQAVHQFGDYGLFTSRTPDIHPGTAA
jgi:hypothetical protein